MLWPIWGDEQRFISGVRALADHDVFRQGPGEVRLLAALARNRDTGGLRQFRYGRATEDCIEVSICSVIRAPGTNRREPMFFNVAARSRGSL
jgi:hypothetical protein